MDGYPVLKSNNYDLEQGERSVFDMELKRECSLLLPNDLLTTGVCHVAACSACT